MDIIIRGSRQWYADLYSKCELTKEAGKLLELMNATHRIEENKNRYQTVEAATKVPWYLVASLHHMEANNDFSKCLANGDPIDRKTIHVPAGRGPWPTFEASAIDSLRYDGLSNRDNWDVAKCLEFSERYNGTGYLKYHPSILSPYLWSYTNLYTKGKYVSDGRYDANAVSHQIGVAALFRAMGI